MKENWNKLSIYQKSLFTFLAVFMILTDVLYFGFQQMLGVLCFIIVVFLAILLYKSFKS